MTNSTNLSKHIACSRITIFRLKTDLGWRNSLSSGSFPQFDVSMPRPSRLSEGVLGEIPTGKAAQQEHTLKRLAIRVSLMGLAEDRYRSSSAH